jgi:PhnB protein
MEDTAMKLNPYLAFDGNCSEAFEFYAQCLNGKIEDTPIADQLNPDERDRVMHACLTIGDAVLMGGDSPIGQHQQPVGTSVALHVDDPEEAERVFNALSVDGNIIMPLSPTFWAQKFGMFSDRFGTPWMINCVFQNNDCA